MFLSQTMDEYIDNPMGKGSTAIANRNVIREDLNRRYDKLIRTHGDFEHKIYVHANVFYFHILVPSESKRNNKYDVVIALAPPSESNKVETTLKNYEFTVFSNCPSFVYTYAYVYNQYGFIIPFLRNKYKNITLTSEPKIKNPGEIINYDKSIYFACKFITSNWSFMNLMLLMPQCKDLNMVKFVSSIRNSDEIELEIKKENNRLKEEAERANRPLTQRQKTMLAAINVQHDINRKKYWRGRNRSEIERARLETKIRPQPKIKPKAKIKPR